MAKKQIIYMEKTTGDIKICRTELEGQMLGKGWTKIQFVRNEKGERVTRFEFDNFTIDIQPNGTREVKQHNGNRSAK